MFMVPQTPAEVFAQTSRYAENPIKYLQQALGQESFEKKKPMLSLPEKIDMGAYGSGEHIKHFENHISNFLGKKSGLFFITGVQAQLCALKIYCERKAKRKVAWHVTSHLESAEQKAYEMLYGLERVLLGSNPESLPTVEEIREVVEAHEDDRPTAIVVEVPNRVLGCRTYSFAELEEISEMCRRMDVKLHMDGARLWEIEPYYQALDKKSFKEIVGLFDSVYVSFYKALRGVAGAMLISDDESLISDARIWRRRAGGNPVTLMYEVADCERGFNEMIGTFTRKREKMMRIVRSITEATAKYKTKDGCEKIVTFNPETANCCQIHTVFNGFTAEELHKARERVQEIMNIRVFEHLISNKTVDERMEEERTATDGKVHTIEQQNEPNESRRHSVEWAIISVTEKLDDQVFVDGYVAFCEALLNEL
ncbi:hypothetical protein M433DRAFT_142454 [Acidomyces richmondensis BFW]|nr:hypothetical protein M433DRAFT_142454 [Acidomyces richmondensis BFW]